MTYGVYHFAHMVKKILKFYELYKYRNVAFLTLHIYRGSTLTAMKLSDKFLTDSNIHTFNAG